MTSARARSDSAERTPLVLVGCDFRRASTAWRSALVLTAEERAGLVDSLRSAGAATGLVVLETCHRIEWIAGTTTPEWTAELLRTWMLRRWRERRHADLTPQPYARVGVDAVRHLLRVAVGLDSLIAGEREIAAQCRRAVARARAEGASCRALDALAQAAARTVRRVERTCAFRDAGRGVHSLAALHALQRAATIRQERGPAATSTEAPERALRVAVAGLGEIGRKTLAALTPPDGPVPQAYNRTLRPGLPPGTKPLSALAADAAQLDILVVATGGLSAPLSARELSAQGREHPLLVIDLGVPAQVIPDAAAVGVILEGLDELVARVSPGRSDEVARGRAEAAVEEGVEDHAMAWRKQESVGLLERARRTRSTAVRDVLPSLLDAHVPELEPARRRRLESALRELIGDQHRLILDHVGRGGASGLENRGGAPGQVERSGAPSEVGSGGAPENTDTPAEGQA